MNMTTFDFTDDVRGTYRVDVLQRSHPVMMDEDRLPFTVIVPFCSITKMEYDEGGNPYFPTLNSYLGFPQYVLDKDLTLDYYSMKKDDPHGMWASSEDVRNLALLAVKRAANTAFGGENLEAQVVEEFNNKLTKDWPSIDDLWEVMEKDEAPAEDSGESHSFSREDVKKLFDSLSEQEKTSALLKIISRLADNLSEVPREDMVKNFFTNLSFLTGLR